MIVHPRITLVILTIFLGCGGGDSPTVEAENSSQTLQENKNSSPSTTQTADEANLKTQQSANVSLRTCIQESLEALEKTPSTLDQLSCSNLTDRDFRSLSTLPALTKLNISDTPLTKEDITNLANNINPAQITSLILENNNLTKDSVDAIDPLWQNSYGDEHYTSMTHLSLKNNAIEGLLVVDYFPTLLSLDLSGNIYPSSRLHHVGFVESLNALFIGDNPNITTLDDLSDGPSAAASIEHMDITAMPNLRDISELLTFQKLKTLTIDSTEASEFITILDTLQDKGVRVIVR